MIEPIILSDTDASEAKSVFEHWLTQPVVLWVVLGTDPIAKMAVAKAEELINSDQSVYHSSRVIHATNPSLLLDKLKSLTVNPKLRTSIKWNDLDDYVILSISVNTDMIAAIVLKSKFPNQPRGYINRILRKAVACDAS
ncbi:hypothetical protein [Aquimarina sp. 2201CG5-10]|uniref:hypothetical protein n=1 Tax=Aquimarina callyspongiae TaxID=3098150 RepID=UPI002AB46DC3|nr:hypothetical protein [Aquimarina sp. 2201CG5-10]MDY8135817.1 hypothetical protein [Aquimarina sp. 2201CG5-10]